MSEVQLPYEEAQAEVTEGNQLFIGFITATALENV